MQKIGMLVSKQDKEAILSFLQREGVLHLTDAKPEEGLTPAELSDHLSSLHYKVAELNFAIGFLSRFEAGKKGLQAMVDGNSVKVSEEEIASVKADFKWKPVVETCKKLEETMVDLNNEKKTLTELQGRLRPWTHLTTPLSDPRETETARVVFAAAPLKEWEALKSEILAHSELAVIEMDNMLENTVYFQVVCEKSMISDIEGMILTHKGEVVELPELKGNPQEELQKTDRRFHEIATRIAEMEESAGKETHHLRNLRILFDALNWELIRKESDRKFLSTESALLISGWVPKNGLENLKKDLHRVNPNFELFGLEPEEGEEAPVLLMNKPYLKPFESVTGIYGLPLPSEMDPTPYLAVFFIVFFGLALTDAIYGLLMFAVMFSVLRFLKIPKQSQGLIRLLMYAGIVTFFAGALFGGWASLDVSQVPEWLTYTAVSGEKMFIGQKISAITNPMGVLILSLVLGYIQVLFGVIINFIHKYKTQNKRDALMDDFPWVLLLSFIGLTILAWQGVILPAGLFKSMLYLCLLSALVVAFIRPKISKKPAIWMIPLIPLKLVFDGILRLYGLVGYLSDVLSYSRLLALGLATAIIGLAVNTIAGMVNGVPYVGILLAIVVLIVGHAFNLGINALGAFIHSGRLQFVEFFTKFLEGGGKAFSPLRKESRFVRVSEET